MLTISGLSAIIVIRVERDSAINMTQTICIGGHNSRGTLIEYSIPQRSVSGPILSTLPLGAIVRKHNLQYHLYADYTQLYDDFAGTQVGEAYEAADRIEEEARQWMTDHIVARNRKHLQDISCVKVC